MEIILSLGVIVISALIYSTFMFGKKRRKTNFQTAKFHSLSCKSNGIVPSSTDELLESWKCPQTSYFFASDKETLFQLTLKKKSRGCFFVVRFAVGNYKYENCGLLEDETDGFRGRYLQVSKLEDCRRWRIILLCRLIGSNDDNSQEEKFVRLNLFFQALQQPVGDSSVWIQWGVLQGQMITPKEDKRKLLYLRGVRGKHSAGERGKFLVFIGDHGRLIMSSQDKNKEFASLFLPGEPLLQVQRHSLEREGRVFRATYLDERNRSYQLLSHGDTKATLDDWEEGVLVDLVIPNLDMVEDPDRQQPSLNTEPANTPLVVPFQSETCDDPWVTGGKGASLGKLSKMDGVTVPGGFCLTVKFFEALVDTELRGLLEELEITSKMKCSERQRLEEISVMARAVFDSSLWDLRVAVRSSAVGEDGLDHSSAGQNESLLGVRGEGEVTAGILACWASLYGPRSVEYRRQAGGGVVGQMSVVIQEMVRASKAGVIFTADPVTGESGRLTITANWGLGETVVSGVAEPDTVLVTTTADLLTVTEMRVGSKLVREECGEDGEVVVSRMEAPDQSCCLTEDEALSLAEIALHMDREMNLALDIEFCFTEWGEVRILQARPVTTAFRWTDWELTHELDTAFASDHEISTRGNVGEVLPGALTPLTLSTVVKCLDLGLAHQDREKSGPGGYISHTNSWISVINNQVFLKFLDALLRHPEAKLTVANRGIDLAVFGHEVTNEALRRHQVRDFVSQNLLLVKDIITGGGFHKKILRQFSLLNLFPKLARRKLNCKALYGDISDKLHFLLKISQAHCYNSERSSIIQMIIFLILVGDNSQWSPNMLSEVAILLTHDDQESVESAGVPKGLQNVADQIKKFPDFEEKFCQSSVEEAEHWLRSNLDLQDFLSNFGHRCLKEFELMSRPWGDSLSPVVKTLQAMLNTDNISRPTESLDLRKKAIIAALPLGKRVALRLLLPLAHSCVANREASKSLLIRTIGQFRSAYSRLGLALTECGLIQSEDLVWHLTHHELGQCLDSKSLTRTRLLAKAVRRRQLFPKWDNKTFAEMVTGSPAVLEAGEEEGGRVVEVVGGGVVVRGTPACPGCVRGPARVVTHLSQAEKIVPGDVLVTVSTDIGWSPYFPILAGVVTELGGLISHGAVVAREYGLPCLVGAQHATDLFRDGDMVCLDTVRGELVKLEM